MARMHERTRRFICRAAFLLLCVAPTAIIAPWSIARSLPSHAAAETLQLRELLGLDVTVGRVTHPLPGVILFENVEVADPETGEFVAHLRSVEITHSGTKTLVEASQVELSGNGAEHFWSLVDRRLRRGMSSPESQVYFSASELTWHGAETLQTFTDFGGRLGPTKEGVEVDLKFRLAGQQLVDLASLRIERKLRDGRPSTHAQFNTGGGRFSARLLEMLAADCKWFGPDAEFEGYLSLEEREGSWTGDLQGRLAHVDLDTLVSERFPHTLSGQAEVTIRKAIIKDSRLVEADGSIRAGPGMVSRSLLVAGVEHLGMQAQATLDSSATTTTLSQLAATFVLTQRGLQILGECTSAPGVVMTGPDGVLWRQPSYEAQPVTQLIRTLAPPSELQVSASDESRWLINALPVPQIVQPRASLARPPQVHLKVVPR